MGAQDEFIKENWRLLPKDFQQALLIAGFQQKKGEKQIEIKYVIHSGPKNHRLSIRVSRDELTVISRAAQAEGKNVSKYILSKSMPQL